MVLCAKLLPLFFIAKKLFYREISLDEQFTTVDKCSIAGCFNPKVFVNCLRLLILACKQLTRPSGRIIQLLSEYMNMCVSCQEDLLSVPHNYEPLQHHPFVHLLSFSLQYTGMKSQILGVSPSRRSGRINPKLFDIVCAFEFVFF